MASWSGFWGDGVGSTDTYALQNGLNGRSAILHRIKTALNKAGSRRLKEEFDAALDAAVGAATARTFARIAGTADPGNPVVNGAVRTIDTVDAMASATITAAEEAVILAAAQYNPGHDLVSDSSGNGGGGKLLGVSY